MTDTPQDEPSQDEPERRRPLRLETRIPNDGADSTYWTHEAVQSLVGQQPRLTLGGDPRRGAVKVLVVAARQEGNDVIATVEVPDLPDGSDLAAALAAVQRPDGAYSLGAGYQVGQSRRLLDGRPPEALSVRLHELYPSAGNHAHFAARDAASEVPPPEPAEVLPVGYARLPDSAWRDGIEKDTVIEVAQVIRWEPSAEGGTRVMLAGDPGGVIVTRMPEAEFTAWFTRHLSAIREGRTPGGRFPHPTFDAFGPRSPR